MSSKESLYVLEKHAWTSAFFGLDEGKVKVTDSKFFADSHADAKRADLWAREKECEREPGDARKSKRRLARMRKLWTPFGRKVALVAVRVPCAVRLIPLRVSRSDLGRLYPSWVVARDSLPSAWLVAQPFVSPAC